MDCLMFHTTGDRDVILCVLDGCESYTLTFMHIRDAIQNGARFHFLIPTQVNVRTSLILRDGQGIYLYPHQNYLLARGVSGSGSKQCVYIHRTPDHFVILTTKNGSTLGTNLDQRLCVDRVVANDTAICSVRPAPVPLHIPDGEIPRNARRQVVSCYIDATRVMQWLYLLFAMIVTGIVMVYLHNSAK